MRDKQKYIGIGQTSYRLQNILSGLAMLRVSAEFIFKLSM